MRTKVKAADAQSIEEAARYIRAGEVVAFPTETVYGLGANGLDASAVLRIFEAKERPCDNPLIFHIADAEALNSLTPRASPRARALMERFWPGPLTLIHAKAACVPDEATGGLGTVAVRMPAHPVALALIRAAGCPIAAPSANRSGRPSPTRAEHVLEDLDGRIPLILDGG
ncbi:MAG TPA: L-threonylcarbamoyladenylate synthase, partial [Clostridia bacterium]|nr:L-threonylcarbamoyladenylate synthase [Clostridia bacterium]